jgi:hypothetical protein
VELPLPSEEQPLKPDSLPPVVDGGWAFEPAVRGMLEHYTAEGDVQTCVAVALVLGARLALEPALRSKWILSYLGTAVFALPQH